MTTLVCKMCGGSIELTGESHGRCDSCGCEVTLPKIDDSKRADMYNRGNHFRTIGDFDKAYSAYEHIIADDQRDAEAHWCLMLCRYGVEYVKDARTGDYKPTVSRMSFDPVLEDQDYLAALAASDEYTKEIYRREARKIESIQKQYLEISRREQPYDVFICFKAEEPTGGRTRASEMGQDIYERLTEKGLKVFFSRITLEDKLTEAYEPYIFAALNSAKVMLVVANKPEQLQARWVKNEWTRYLNMMDKDRSKHILPVFEGMSPYDFPAEIPMVQGLDMSKIGSMQDLIRGVCKITGHLYEQRAAAPAATSQVSISSGLLFRARQAVEDAVYDEAIRLLEDLLNREPENGEAYYYYFLAEHRVTELPSRVNEQHLSWPENRYFKRALQYCEGRRKEDLRLFHLDCKLLRTRKDATALAQSETEEDLLKALKLLDNFDHWVEKEGLKVEDPTVLGAIRQTVQGKLNDLYAARRAKEQDEADYAAALAEYRSEIGDPKTYLQRMMQERYPDQIEKMNKLKKKRRVNRFTYELGYGFFPLLFSILLLVVGYLWNNGVEIFKEDCIMVYFRISVVSAYMVLMIHVLSKIGNGIIRWILYFAVFYLILGLFIGSLTSNVDELFLEVEWIEITIRAVLGLGAFSLLISLWRSWRTIRYRMRKKEYDKYTSKVLRPLVKQLEDDVEARWGAVIKAKDKLSLYFYY